MDDNLHVKGEEQAYAEAVQGAVGGAAGVVHRGGALHTDCGPNRNVEAMRLALIADGIESRPRKDVPTWSLSAQWPNG